MKSKVKTSGFVFNLINFTPMAFTQANGRSYTIWLPKAASTVFSVGDLVQPNGTGEITRATTTSNVHLGVIQKNVVATDSDYASTTLVPVTFPVDDTEFFVSVGTGTATEAIIGTFIDLATASSVDVTASAVDAVLVTGVISGTVVKVKLNSMASYKNAI